MADSVKIWIARDGNKDIVAHSEIPELRHTTLSRIPYYDSAGDYISLPQNAFPTITHETGPVPAEIRLIDPHDLHAEDGVTLGDLEGGGE